MSTVHIPWRPRLILTNRTFRLPVQAPTENITLETDGIEQIATRWVERDSARYHYLRTPNKPGTYTLRALHNGETTETTLRVQTLDELRTPHKHNGADWPRRWPVAKAYQSTKTRQTLQVEQGSHPLNSNPGSSSPSQDQVAWWTSQPDDVIWQQLPGAELPKAHFANAHQGCPSCGTAIFKYSGFYPWVRNHLPCDFKSTCPNCGSIYPSNNLTDDDFISGNFVDDGYGYFDKDGHIFLFAATYHRDQCRAFGSGIGALTTHLQANGLHEETTRKLGIMLLRYAVEECYIASAVQFRYGPSKGVEEPWNWGQPDWADESNPVAALQAKGSVRYSIDTPYIIETLATAYDTVWPLLREDQELVSRAQALGLNLQSPQDTTNLIEEMLATLLQTTLDRGASSNLPRESQGALILLRCLDRTDAKSVMDWVYDEGPDTLRVFTSNDFYPDGTPQEATGGYNSIHSDGLFDLEYHLYRLRETHAEAYPESQYPSLMSDPRAARVPRALQEITMIGRSYFQYGDGSAPGSARSHGADTQFEEGTIRLKNPCLHAPLSRNLLNWAAEFTGDPIAKEIRDTVQQGQYRNLDSTVHDGVGIAILRTSETPERAAAGIVYGDALHHRHRDLLDAQLFAFERPFLTDLGYPQSWASAAPWEGHWATHNTAWGALPPGESRSAGRGRLVRSIFIDGLQILDMEADRWAWDSKQHAWITTGVTYRRLLALVETEGEGVALIDLSRVTGGTEHWRTCRGLEGEFQSNSAGLKPRTGTVAVSGGKRGDTDNLPHPDYTALAYMDDVATGQAPAAWNGAWQSRRESSVHMDLHQVNVSPNTELFTARATEMMGKPEESNYSYRTLLWRRTPQNDTTCVDLVFEPRTGDATLQSAEAISSDSATAAGIRLTSRNGRRIDLYWAPDANPDTGTNFDDGTSLQGALAAVIDGTTIACGTTAITIDTKSTTFEHATQTGRITALNRDTRTINVQGLSGISAGDRIVINPNGRAHNYLVESVKNQGDSSQLTLDVTSILGRAEIISAENNQLSFGFQILAKSGNLQDTRVETETGDAWAEVSGAANPGGWPPGSVRTILSLNPKTGNAQTLLALSPGKWVQAVDYVVGDTVLYEPLCRS